MIAAVPVPTAKTMSKMLSYSLQQVVRQDNTEVHVKTCNTNIQR